MGAWLQEVVWCCGLSWPCWGSCAIWAGDMHLGSPWDSFVLKMCPKLQAASFLEGGSPHSSASVLLHSQASKMQSDLGWWSWFPSQLNTVVIVCVRNLQVLVVGSWLLQWSAHLVGGGGILNVSVYRAGGARGWTHSCGCWMVAGFCMEKLFHLLCVTETEWGAAAEAAVSCWQWCT